MRATSGDSEWIDFLKVGTGTEMENGRIALPAEVMCTSIIVGAVYGETIDAGQYHYQHASRLGIKKCVDQLNAYVLARMNSRVYKSTDKALTEDSSDAIHYQPEFLHRLSSSGKTPHELCLRKGAIVMLLSILNVSPGLCNGTRVVVEHLRSTH